jgi:hypothetical protein
VATLAVLLLGAGLSACPMSGIHGATEGTDLNVMRSGRLLARLTFSEVQHLPQVEVQTPQSPGAQIQKGPTVRSILDGAGTTGVSSVRVEGRDPPQTLTAVELTDELILDVTKRNTLKLAGTKLGIDRWVRDVTTLDVNP